MKKKMVGLLMAMTFVVCGQAAPSDAVCKIGSTQFASLSDAFASPLLQEPGVTNTITLLRDVSTGSVTNGLGCSTLLDLNGHVINGTSSPIFVNCGTLVVDDLSKVGEGRISGGGGYPGLGIQLTTAFLQRAAAIEKRDNSRLLHGLLGWHVCWRG